MRTLLDQDSALLDGKNAQSQSPVLFSIYNRQKEIRDFLISRGAVLELHEAAAIDGASGWRIFWEITWLLLLPLTTILTIFSAIFTFTDFQLIWTITRGGPANATHLFVTLAYQRAIPGGALGEGAAIAGFTLPFLALLSWAALDALRRQP